MSILKGDIKLMASKVMDDVPEGGGGPTGTEIQDGVSNEVFPDISELDRAMGRLNMRQVHMEVHTDNRDTYLGANVVVATPPDDPNVSITLMETGGTFDTRSEAVARLEAYLFEGPRKSSFLFGNHIAGQSTIQWYQRNDTLPAIGETLVLVKRETFGDEFRQYVRVTEVSASLQTFDDDKGEYQRWVVVATLLMPLTQDFPGFDVQRIDPTAAQIRAATKIAETVVANAASYKGVTVSEDAVEIGDFTIKGETIYTQLVPSAQVETPLADVRTNQTTAAVVSTGNAVAQTINATFTATQGMFVGGMIAPGSLSVVSSGVTVTDQGGLLVSGGSQVGLVDYENGLLTLLTNVFGTGPQTFTVTYSLGATPSGVSQAAGFEVTVEGRAQNYVRTFTPAPVRGTMTVSYMAQGRWYVLMDGGDGALRGSDSGYGAGQINFTTGTVSVTLGALPDVGSAIIYTWTQPTAARDTESLPLQEGSRFFWPINSDGDVTLGDGSTAFDPGTITLTWDDGSARTATDNGAGALTGDATGAVSYADGTLRFSPNTMPAPGTPITMTVDKVARTSATASVSSSNGDFGVTGITPGSVRLTITAQIKATSSGPLIGWVPDTSILTTGVYDWGPPRAFLVTDDGDGKLFAHAGGTKFEIGTIDYGAGTFLLASNPTIPREAKIALCAWDNPRVTYTLSGGMGMSFAVVAG